MTGQSPDPLRVLAVAHAHAAEQLATWLAGETGATTLDAVAVLDGLGALGYTLVSADALERDAVSAAYLSF